MNVYKLVEIEPKFSTLSDLKDDFKTRFVSNTYINQTLINKPYIPNTYGLIFYTTCLTTQDPTIKNHAFDIPTPTIDMYLKFPISNSEFQSTHEKLTFSPNYFLSSRDTDDSISSNTNESLCALVCQSSISTSCHTNKSFVSRACSKIHQIYENISSLGKPKYLKNDNKNKNHGIRVCY